jgi:hypothetical protein
MPTHSSSPEFREAPPLPNLESHVERSDKAQACRDWIGTAERTLFSSDAEFARLLDAIGDQELTTENGEPLDAELLDAVRRAYVALTDVFRRQVGIDDRTWKNAVEG